MTKLSGNKSNTKILVIMLAATAGEASFLFQVFTISILIICDSFLSEVIYFKDQNDFL